MPDPALEHINREALELLHDMAGFLGRINERVSALEKRVAELERAADAGHQGHIRGIMNP